MTTDVLVGFIGIGVTVVGSAFAVILKQSVSAARFEERLSGFTDALKGIRADMKESAESQGIRLGKNEDSIAVLQDWRARMEGAEARERELEMSGAVRTK